MAVLPYSSRFDGAAQKPDHRVLIMSGILKEEDQIHRYLKHHFLQNKKLSYYRRKKIKFFLNLMA